MTTQNNTFIFKNAPYSPKFPQTNQTNYCWYAYIQHKVCLKKNDDENAIECLQARSLYRNLCPNQWIEEWDEQVANDVFAGSHIWEDI